MLSLRTVNKKSKGDEYYTSRQVFEVGALWNFVYGSRSTGKSYDIKKRNLIEALKDPENCKFFYLRRYSEDVSTFAVCNYFGDMIKMDERGHSVLSDLSGDKFNNVKAAKRKIWLIKIDEEGKETNRLHVGYYDSIGNAERLKSQCFGDVTNIIFEEFIASSKPYLNNEPKFLESIVSTVFRNGVGRVWCIGNDESRDCPYFRYFGLAHVKRQKPGTIDIYEKEQMPPKFDDDGNPETVRIATEYTGERPSSSGMFFGIGSKNINGNTWNSSVHAKMPASELDGFDAIYVVVFKYHDLMFLGTLYNDPKTCGAFWYVEPKTRGIQRGTRVVSDEVEISPLYTQNLNPLNSGEGIAFKLLKDKKIFYSDDLTGSEFENALTFFLNN